jgi:two-component system, chemotaxis family, protein-glutamate methylesterase/glutaminase
MGAIVVIAGSAGGLDPLRQIIAALPVPCSASVFVVMHIGPNRSVLPSLLTRPGLPASFAKDYAPIEPGHVYVAPPDHHILLEPGRMRLSQGPKVNYTRPAADPLFESAAEAYGSRVLGIVLSGGDSDGAIGLRVIKERGGTSIVQRPEDAVFPSMPEKALAVDHPDGSLSVSEIGQLLAARCSNEHFQLPAKMVAVPESHSGGLELPA